MNNPLEVTKVEGIGKPSELPEQKPEPEALINGNVVEEAEIHAVAKSLGVDKFSDMAKYDDQMKRIIEWAKTKGALSLTDLVSEINTLRNRVGNKNIYNMSVYAGIELERMKLDSKLKKLE